MNFFNCIQRGGPTTVMVIGHPESILPLGVQLMGGDYFTMHVLVGKFPCFEWWDVFGHNCGLILEINYSCNSIKLENTIRSILRNFMLISSVCS